MIREGKLRLSYTNIFLTVYSILLATAIIITQTYLSEIIPLSYYVIKYTGSAILLGLFLVENLKMNVQSIGKIVLIMVCVVGIYSFTGSNYLVDLVVLILACKNVDCDRLIRCDLKVRGVLFLITFVLGGIGIISSANGIKDGYIRNSMGFTHVNALSLCAFVLLCGYIYINYNSISFKKIIIMVLYVLLVFQTTRTVTFLYVSLIAVFMCIYLRHNLRKRRESKFLLKILLVILAVSWLFSIFMMIWYDPSVSWMYALNKFLSGRLALMSNAYKEFGINNFGQIIQWVTTNQASSSLQLNVVDNGIARLLLTQGWIATILLLGGILILFLYSMRANKALCLILALFAIYGISESGCYYVYTNPFLIFLGQIVYSKGQVHNDTMEGENNG